MISVHLHWSGRGEHDRSKRIQIEGYFSLAPGETNRPDAASLPDEMTLS